MLRWLVCVAATIIWLTGCSSGSTQWLLALTQMAVDGTLNVQPTGTALPVVLR